MAKTVFITGTASGIGKETALYFLEKGWNVVATMRNPDKRKTELHDKKMDLLHLDVLDKASIQTAVDTVLKKYGKIDALVNNAGYGVLGAFELATGEQVEKEFGTNVLGLMDVTRAVLPSMRAQKDGVIVNIASIGGKITLPYYSLYHGTKWAVEGFSESLAYELRPLGIKVRIIEPGIINTDFYERSLVEAKNEAAIRDYDAGYQRFLKSSRALDRFASHPRVVARAIYKAATDKGYKLRYYKGAFAGLTLFLRKVLPDGMFNAIFRAI